ncbi:SSI family serine proteinase inhibitor [Streptomyces sp. NPDC056121]|uniref:SSI family serine proteinase inhibitor n=1 Tax=unclassified Streptomyces TaxID=2593676 RepID=UPI0022525C34|nr:SSI family serine proteinase inhibitor [Streptomyces sp. NBC_00401]MCX5080207.1 subtilase-type protease inhibitor [Streptomyces sp. NBC_00401]
MRPHVLAAAVLTALAAALTALAAAGPARAAATDPPAPQGVFLTVSGDQGSWIRGELLRCEPEAWGHHPHASEACGALDRAHGNLDALVADPEMCTQVYAPVTVSASGTYRGKQITWQKTYANACTMQASTGYVFRF